MNRLTDEDLDHFEREGFLLVRGLLDWATDLRPVWEEYEQVLDRLIDELIEVGEMRSRHEDLPFGKRLTQAYRESGRVLSQYFDCSLPQKGTREDSPIWVGPEVFRALSNETLLDAVEDLIGPENLLESRSAHSNQAAPGRSTGESARSQDRVSRWLRRRCDAVAPGQRGCTSRRGRDEYVDGLVSADSSDV